MKSNDDSIRNVGEIPVRYVAVIISFGCLLVAYIIFQNLPTDIKVGAYREKVLSVLAGITLTTIANVILRLIQTSVNREAVRALQKPIVQLDSVADKLRQVQFFYEAGVLGVFANRRVAMQHFLAEIEREDGYVEFVGTSLLGILDPSEESEDKRQLHDLLLQKKARGVKIRALLMHPAYGEFRERVENRARAMVAKDIQKTLRYLVDCPTGLMENAVKEAIQRNKARLLTKSDVRLYPGVITAFAVFTSRSMLVNVSALHGPVYDNLTLIIEDRPDPNSLFKRFRANHFEEPWKSEKTIQLDGNNSDLLCQLLKLDFNSPNCRFVEGEWPKTILHEG